MVTVSRQPGLKGDAAPSPSMVGTLRRSYELGGRDPTCVLVTEDGEVFRLNAFESDDPRAALQGPPPTAELARFQSQLVRVRYAEREDSVFGPSLWGVHVELAAEPSGERR